MLTLVKNDYELLISSAMHARMFQIHFNTTALSLAFCFLAGDPDFPESFAQKGKVKPTSAQNVSGLGRGSNLVNRPSRNPGIMASNPNGDLRNNFGFRSSNTLRSSRQEELNIFSDHSKTKLDDTSETCRDLDFKMKQNSFTMFSQNDHRKLTPEHSYPKKLSETKQKCCDQTTLMKSSSCDSSTALVTEPCSTTQTIPISSIKCSNFHPIEISTRRAPGDSVRSVVGLGRAELIRIVQEKRKTSSK